VGGGFVWDLVAGSIVLVSLSASLFVGFVPFVPLAWSFFFLFFFSFFLFLFLPIFFSPRVRRTRVFFWNRLAAR
jgi:hypothetical protein